MENANRAWFKVKRMEKAMTSSVGDELATPASLLQSLRQKNPAQFAAGKMPMQDLARLSQNVLYGDTVVMPGWNTIDLGEKKEDNV